MKFSQKYKVGDVYQINLANEGVVGAKFESFMVQWDKVPIGIRGVAHPFTRDGPITFPRDLLATVHNHQNK